jgi:hypothetical protein
MSRSAVRLLSLAVPSVFVLACGNGFLSRAAQSRNIAALTSTPSLGVARSFSVLGGATVTNTGPTTLSGDLGVYPGSAITGFPPGLLTPPAATHAADAVAGQAQHDVGSAYDVLAAEPCTSDSSGQDLGERTLTPGVYCFSSEALLSGTLVLDAKLDANAVFVFRIVSKLTTASSASVRLINGANPCNVFWQVGSSATVGTGTSFVGNILALTSIALQSGASLNGRALARNGEVTLDDNQIRSGVCAEGGGGSDGGGPDGGGGGGSDGGGGGGPDGGQTQLSCCFGAVACDGACADLKTDANHCGACGTSCAADEVCSAGACAPCPPSRTQCLDQCADLSSDPFNCGACGKICGGSQSCVAGSCGPCDGTVCANICVELSTDRANCGACGNACAADQCCTAGSCSGIGPSGSCKQH